MSTHTKSWWQSRTVWLAIVTMAIAVLEAGTGFLSDARLVALVTAVIGALNLILRVLTDKKIQP